MDSCKPDGNPCAPSIKTGSQEQNNTEGVLLSKETRFQATLGSLQWLGMGTHPDIPYAVQQVAQKTNTAQHADWLAAKRVFQFPRGTSEH